MTKFSNTLDLNRSGIVGSGHPPVLHTWLIPDGLQITPGQILAKTGDTVALWTGGGDAGSGDAAGPRLAIAVNETLGGDGSVTVLVHGCYLFSRALVGDAPLTPSQAESLAVAGLFAENTW